VPIWLQGASEIRLPNLNRTTVVSQLTRPLLAGADSMSLARRIGGDTTGTHPRDAATGVTFFRGSRFFVAPGRA
jgi:hypothetical protein